MTEFVYRCYGTDDVLLYVGATTNVAQRMQYHRTNKEAEWSDQVTRVAVAEYLEHAAALAAERYAIRTEQPLYNIRSTPRGSKLGTHHDPRRITEAGRELLKATILAERIQRFCLFDHEAQMFLPATESGQRAA